MADTPKTRVVLVEDDIEYRAFLAQEIAQAGSAEVVFQAPSEFEARSWLQRHGDSWDIRVLDIFLGKGSGIALLSVLRKRHRDQKVFVLTNFLSPFNKKVIARLNPTQIFDKLTDLESLISACTKT